MSLHLAILLFGSLYWSDEERRVAEVRGGRRRVNLGNCMRGEAEMEHLRHHGIFRYHVWSRVIARCSMGEAAATRDEEEDSSPLPTYDE